MIFNSCEKYCMIYFNRIEHATGFYFLNSYWFYLKISWNRWKCFSYSFIDTFCILEIWKIRGMKRLMIVEGNILFEKVVDRLDLMGCIRNSFWFVIIFIYQFDKNFVRIYKTKQSTRIQYGRCGTLNALFFLCLWESNSCVIVKNNILWMYPVFTCYDWLNVLEKNIITWFI